MPASLPALAESWRYALLAAGRSPKTVTTYMTALRQLLAFLERSGMPATPTGLRREHIEAWLVSLAAWGKPSTVFNRYMAAHSWFKWLRDLGEIRQSPMANMQPPKVPVEARPVLSPQEFLAMLRAGSGDPYRDARDAALLLLLYDCGLRAAELLGLRLQDVDMSRQTLLVRGKGRHGRRVHFGQRAATALRSWLTLRGPGRDAQATALWLGERGITFAHAGLHRMVRRRGRAANLQGTHPHQLRRTFAARWLWEGGSERSLMALAGWTKAETARRYAAAVEAEQALAEHESFSPGDRLPGRSEGVEKMGLIRNCARGGSFSDGRAGWRLSLQYDAEAVEEFKRAVPHQDRDWDGERGEWWVARDHEKTLLRLLPDFAAYLDQPALPGLGVGPW